MTLMTLIRDERQTPFLLMRLQSDEEKEPVFSWSDGLLWRHSAEGNQLCVTTEERESVLKAVHDELVHPGGRRAYLFAKKRYFWPGMRKQIMDYCKSCPACQLAKSDTSKKPGELFPIATPGTPFDTICIDFVEAMPACRGYDGFVTITDKCSKAVIIFPCRKNTTAEQFAAMFLEKVVPFWGIPARIISDRDRRFISAFWRLLMRRAGTKIAMTTSFHPQGDGQSEKSNKTIETMMRLVSIDHPDRKWVDMMPSIMLAHNSTPHTSMLKSPYEILYATNPKSFGDLFVEPPDASRQENPVADAWSKELLERRSLALDLLKRAQASQKKHWDKKRVRVEFNPGESAKLLVRNASKLAPLGVKVKIVEKVTDGAYRIITPEGSKMHDVVSIEHLRKFNERMERAEQRTRGNEMGSDIGPNVFPVVDIEEVLLKARNAVDDGIELDKGTDSGEEIVPLVRKSARKKKKKVIFGE